MIFEFVVYKGEEYVDTLYIMFEPKDHTVEEFQNFIMASFMEYRTHCVLKGYECNIFHFKNWMKKNKFIDFSQKPKTTIVRVDF